MTDKSYNLLKSMAVDKSVLKNGINSVDINVVKTLYKSQIDSNRAFSQIESVCDLIKVLEKRGCLSPIDIDAFDYIFSFLNLPQDLIEEHKELINLNRHCNFLKRYDEINTHEQVTQGMSSLWRDNRATTKHCHEDRLNRSTFETNQLHRNYPKLPDKVIGIICDRIGSSWKSLGYQLGLQVGTVDRIEEDRSITTNEERAKLVLHQYQQNVESSEIKLNLLKALELIQRKDLHDKIQKCFLLNS